MVKKAQFLRYFKIATEQHLYLMERNLHPGVVGEHALARESVKQVGLSLATQDDSPIVKAVIMQYRFKEGAVDATFIDLLIAIEEAWEYYEAKMEMEELRGRSPCQI